MNSLKYSYFAPLAVILATFFLLGGCFSDEEKSEAQRQERLQRDVFAIHEEMLLSGDTDRAIAELEKLDKKFPDKAEVISALGRAYTEKGDPLMAAFYFDYAFELSPEEAELALLAAEAHLGSGNKAEAAAAYRSYLRLNAQVADVWHKLALLEMEQGNFQPALSAYLEALRLSGEPPLAQDKLNLAILYHNLGNQPQAQRWYTDLLLEENLDAQLRIDGMVGQFDLLLRQKQWDEAIELMYALDALAPNTLQDGPYAVAYAELVQWDKQRKQAAEQQKAEEAKAAAAEITEAAAAAESTEAQAVAKTEKRESTVDAKAAVSAPENAAGETEAVDVAQRNAASGIEAAPTPADTELEATQAAAGASGAEVVEEFDVEKSGKIEALSTTTEIVEAASPAEPQPEGTAEDVLPTAKADASVASAADSIPGGLAQGEDAAARAQDASAVALAAQGREAFEAEDYVRAAELLERSVKLNPGNAEALDMLSRACFRIEQYPQAERFAALATYAAPKNVNYRLEYLRAYQRNNPPPSMLQQLITAKEDFPEDPSVTLALARGYEYIAQRKALAADLYHEYLKLAPAAPQAKAIQQKLLEWEM